MTAFLRSLLTSATLLLLFPLFAQDALSPALDHFSEPPLLVEEAPPKDDFRLIGNVDPRVFFLDLESIHAKVDAVVVVDRSGREVWKKDAFGLPTNAIFEMALHDLPAGEYQVELRMFSKTLRRQLLL